MPFRLYLFMADVCLSILFHGSSLYPAFSSTSARLISPNSSSVMPHNSAALRSISASTWCSPVSASDHLSSFPLSVDGEGARGRGPNLASAALAFSLYNVPTQFRLYATPGEATTFVSRVLNTQLSF